MILSSIVFLPLLFALIVAVWPKTNTIRHLALGLSVVEFILSLALFRQFDPNSSGLQMVEKQCY